MKKKITLTLLALMCALCCALGLAACQKKPPAKTLDHISCEVTHSKFDGAQFNYTYGDTIDISESNFTVTAHYSDNSTESVTEFTLDKSQLPTDTTQLGTYNISIEYDTAAAVNYSVVIGEKQYSIDIDNYKEIEYTGEEINIVTALDGLKALIDEGKVVIDEQTGTQKATNVGEYTLKIKSAPGYEEKSLTVTWKITKAEVAVPAVANASIVYDGSEHGIEFTKALPTYITLQSNDKHTNAGSYSYTLQVDGNHTFPNNEASATVTMTISKKALTYNQADVKVTGTYTYNANLTINDINHNVDTAYFDVALNSQTKIGDTYIIVTPKENTRLNYTWKDGTEISENAFQSPFTIGKATLDITGKDTENNLVFELDYADNLTNSSVINVNSNDRHLTENSVKWAKENLKFEDGNSVFSTTDTSEVNAGEVTKTVSYTPDERYYNPVEVKVKVIIHKAKIIVKNLSWRLDIAENFVIEYDKQVHSCELSYNKSDLSLDTPEITRSSETVYKATEQGDYGQENIESPKNAGYYKTTVTISCKNSADGNNYDIYLEGENAVISPQVKEWQITKKQVTLYAGDFDWSGLYKNSFEPASAQSVSVAVKSGVDSDIGATVDSVTVGYKAAENAEYQTIEANNIKAVGYYKVQLTLSCGANYTLSADCYKGVEFEIIPNIVDCSGVAWAVSDNATYTKSELASLGEFVTSLPQGVNMLYSCFDSTGRGHEYSFDELINSNPSKIVPGEYIINVNSATLYDYENKENVAYTAPSISPEQITITIVDDGNEKADITGGTSTLVNWETLDADGNRLLSSDNPAIQSRINIVNLMLNGNDFVEGNVGKTVVANKDGIVGGTCNFTGEPGRSFEELKGTDYKYYFTYDASRENTVEVYTMKIDTSTGQLVTDENGKPVVNEDDKLVGNLYVSDAGYGYLILTQTIRIAGNGDGEPDTHIMWRLTFEAKCTINFLYNNPDAPDTVFETVTVDGGSLIPEPETDPDCDFYTFLGWYTAAEGGDPVDFTVTRAFKNIDLYAHWEYVFVATDTFDAEFTYIDPTAADGYGKIVEDDGLGATTRHKSGSPFADKNYYVSSLYKQGTTLEFVIYSSAPCTATLYVSAALDDAFGTSDTFTSADGDRCYSVIVNDTPLEYGTITVTNTFQEISLGKINIVESENSIKLVTNNTCTDYGGETQATAPMIDYIRIEVDDPEAEILWWPQYDNLENTK